MENSHGREKRVRLMGRGIVFGEVLVCGKSQAYEDTSGENGLFGCVVGRVVRRGWLGRLYRQRNTSGWKMFRRLGALLKNTKTFDDSDRYCDVGLLGYMCGFLGGSALHAWNRLSG